MDAADGLLAVMWAALTLYTLLGGADFGGGWWDLVARGPDNGARQRDLVERAIGPVWEANHVWLILVVTLFWTAFPPAFAAFASTLYIPLTLAALGIIGRGAAFAFRKASLGGRTQRLYGLVFAYSSIATPFFLGTIVGAVASGRVPPGIAAGDVWHSWLNLTSVWCGLLAVGLCGYLAAVYLVTDARRAGAADLVAAFRRRALGSGVVVGSAALAGLVVLSVDAPRLFDALTHRGMPVVLLSVVAGLASLYLVGTGRAVAATAARATAGLAVACVLWAWGLAQYPVLLFAASPVDDLTVEQAAGDPAVLHAVLAALTVGGVLLVPSLLWLFILFQRDPTRHATADLARPDSDASP